MATFLDKAEFNDSEQKESAKKIIKNWSNAYTDFANDEKMKWQEVHYNEAIEDVAKDLRILVFYRLQLCMTILMNWIR